MAFVLIYANNTEELVRRLKDVELGSFSTNLIIGSGEFKAAFSFVKKTDALSKIVELIKAISSGQEILKLNEGLFFTKRKFNDDQLAFVFPGQGSQQKQMMKKFLSDESFKKTFDSLNTLSQKKYITDLNSLIYDESCLLDIDETQWTQPALGIVCSSLLELLLSKGMRPSLFAGHSFGEIVALHASGCFSHETLLDIAFERGKLMASANDKVPGKMLAVIDKSAQSYLDLVNKVSAYLNKGQCELANINNHNQIVLSGTVQSIENVKRIAEELGMRSTILRASAAFHSSLMKPIQLEFQEFLANRIDDFNDPKKFVASNIEGASYKRVQNIIQNLSAQLSSQVNWVSTVSRLYQNGARVFVEIGPKNTLSKLIDDILPEKECYTIALDGPVQLEHQMLFFKILGLTVEMGDSQQTDSHIVPDRQNFAEIETDNRVVAFFIEKQKELLLKADQLIDIRQKKEVVEKIVGDTEKVVLRYYETRLSSGSAIVNEQARDDRNDDDEIVSYVKNEISRLTGFEYQEITLDKNLEHDLMLDSITKMDMFASISQKYRDSIEDVESLFNLKSVRDIIQFLRKIENTNPKIKEKKTVEHIWLRDEIAAHTGFSPSEITPQLDFSDDLMLDSIMRAEIFTSFIREFPHLSLSEEDVATLRSLKNLDELLKRNSPKPIVDKLKKESTDVLKREQKKFSVSFRNSLSEYLQKPLEEIHSNSHFEFDLNLTIFEREEILNSLILEYPYVQIAGRALLNAQTVGQVIEIERGVDKRSRERDEEKVNRFHFDLASVQRHPFQEGRFVKPIYFMPILCDGEGIEIESFLKKSTKLVCARVELEEDITPALNTLSEELVREKHDLLFLFKSHSQHFSEYSRSLRLIHGLGQKLLDIGSRYSNLQVKIIFDPGENFYLKGLVSFFRSLVRESNLSVTIVEMQWKGLSPRDLPWDLLWGNRNSENRCLSYRMISGKIFEERLSDKVNELNKKLSLDLPDNLKVLIMGGGRGITSEISKYFASQHSAHVYAVGRTTMPKEHPYKDIRSNRELREYLWERFKSQHPINNQDQVNKEFNAQYDRVLKERELWTTKENIEQRGGSFTYFSADLSNLEECRNVLEEIERVSGGIQGVIHAPGLILDNLLSRKAYEDFNLVIRTKADSAFVLYQFYKDKNLYFAKLLSSLSSWSGAPGQTDYALANEIINRLAQQWNQESSYPVSSLLWSVWSETGLASNTLIHQMKKLNLGLITNIAGTRLFQDDLLYSTGQYDKVMFSPKSTLEFSLKVKNYEV